MNPPKPHKANTSPPTFSELQAKATPGPYIKCSGRDVLGSEDGHFVEFCTTPREANAELIARLMNVARLGAAQTLRDVLERLNCANVRAKNTGIIEFRTDDVEKLIAILNGEAP